MSVQNVIALTVPPSPSPPRLTLSPGSMSLSAAPWPTLPVGKGGRWFGWVWQSIMPTPHPGGIFPARCSTADASPRGVHAQLPTPFGLSAREAIWWMRLCWPGMVAALEVGGWWPTTSLKPQWRQPPQWHPCGNRPRCRQHRHAQPQAMKPQSQPSHMHHHCHTGTSSDLWRIAIHHEQFPRSCPHDDDVIAKVRARHLGHHAANDCGCHCHSYGKMDSPSSRHPCWRQRLTQGVRSWFAATQPMRCLSPCPTRRWPWWSTTRPITSQCWRSCRTSCSGSCQLTCRTRQETERERRRPAGRALAKAGDDFDNFAYREEFLSAGCRDLFSEGCYWHGAQAMMIGGKWQERLVVVGDWWWQSSST